MMKGNEALAEGAIRAGCRYFFGYPITPQNEIPEYMARRMPQVDGVFLQAESEVSAINMVYGAGGAGGRVLTSSSGPGISLKQEGISYIAGAQIPCVIVNVARGGPGLGGLNPSQSDYFQATKGGGHGDYHLLVFAPGTAQEMVDLIELAFDKAEEYRNPVMILSDAIMGQMMEPVVLPEMRTVSADKPWATTGKNGRSKPNVINSLGIVSEDLEKINIELQDKYKRMAAAEVRYEVNGVDDADLVVVAYGTTSRVVSSAITQLRQAGKKVGLFRPITLWPFPGQALADLAAVGKRFLVVEMSAGQMVEDVILSVNDRFKVEFFGKLNGTVPTVREVYDRITAVLSKGGEE
jgi:2-oxoglutarate ferredoxin oxidoreductase subunit alpha